MLKILSFSYCFPNRNRPEWGIFVLQRLTALARQPGVELRVASPVPVVPLVSHREAHQVVDSSGHLPTYYPPFYYIPGILKSLDARFYAHGLKIWLSRLTETWRPDLLDAHFIWPDGVGVSRLAAEFGLPYCITLRGKIYPCLEVPSQRRQCKAALRGAAAVISVDSRMARIACELGTDPARVFVVPNGVDVEHFLPGDKREARLTLGLPDAGRLLVTVAHLGVRKGHREVIQSLAQLPQDVQLVLVGADPTGGRDTRALTDLIESLRLADRVIFAGPQPYERIPDYFRAADAGVLASYREGCPNVVLESLACGRPVVATDVGAVPDLMNEQQGRIVPVQNVQALTVALREVLNQDWSDKAIRHSPAVRSWDEVAGQVFSILAGCVGRRQPGAVQSPVEVK